MSAAQRASAPGHLSHSAWALPELVEAATRAGDVQVATAALRDVSERARRRVVEANDSLTTQEQQVADLAREGRSNQEIGGQLFISPKTVEYHLHKAFAKLGIRSRHQLESVLGRE